jgi:voltage-gated potassium channel
MDAEFESQAPDWYHTYEKWAAYPLFVLSLMFLAAFSIQVLDIQDPVDQAFARIAIPLVWVAFAIDYVVGFVLARNKKRYVRSRPMQLAALVFPPLRLLLLGHATLVLQATASRADRARVYLLFLTTLTAFVGAILVVYFELKVPNSNIRSFGDALWWVGETVSTVGYGDYYPVTIGGRLVAGALFINGVALLSVITAGLAQRFTADQTSTSPASSSMATSTPAPAASAPAGTGSAPAGTGSASAASAPAASAPAVTGSASAGPATAASTETLTISKEALTALQERIAGLETELTNVRSHVVELLNQPTDTPPASPK